MTDKIKTIKPLKREDMAAVGVSVNDLHRMSMDDEELVLNVLSKAFGGKHIKCALVVAIEGDLYQSKSGCSFIFGAMTVDNIIQITNAARNYIGSTLAAILNKALKDHEVT